MEFLPGTGCWVASECRSATYVTTSSNFSEDVHLKNYNDIFGTYRMGFLRIPSPGHHRSDYPQTTADSLERFDGAIQVFTHVRGGNLSAEPGLALRHDRIP